MDEWAMRSAIFASKKRFGAKCSKFAGAVTVAAFRQALQTAGFTSSARDVFIRGVPIEIDLLIPRPGVVAEHGLLYEPEDVRVVFEIKHSGLYSYDAYQGVLEAFRRIQDANPAIGCAYVTLSELRTYRGAMTDAHCRPGQRAFTLFWHRGADGRRTYEATGHWYALLEYLRASVPQ